METYRDELQLLHHRRVYYIVLGGSIMTLLFSLLDYVTVPDRFLQFLNYRIVIAMFGIFLFWLNSRDKNNRFPFWIGFVGFVSVIFVILLMIYQIGGVLSPYYVGLIVAIALYATLAPLTVGETLVAGVILLTGYMVSISSSHSILTTYTVQLFSNLFFMICFILIIATQSWAETVARKSEYLLRKEEDYATSELSSQAETLEKEVKKRSIEQGNLDKRYRQFFNQLADHVVVIKPDGTIVQANNRFNDRFFLGKSSGGKSSGGKSLWDIVDTNDRPGLQDLLSNIVGTGTSLSEVTITLVDGTDTGLEMEVNGNVVFRGDLPHGILLIMRDISTRKEIEKQLYKSLEMKKKTEISAILVLAKLSEFRDVTPLHHLERIREYCKVLSEDLAQTEHLKKVMNPRYIEDIYHASILHDIGKVAIPDEYMAGEVPMVEYEKDLLRRHTLIGGDVIREMEEESEGSGFLTMAKHIAYFHHERWDGTGYPYGLSKREIPLAARIMAVADTYEEMTSMDSGDTDTIHNSVVAYIKENRGSQFDPQIVDSLLNVQNEFNKIRMAYPVDPSSSNL
ncbi:HD domain-containing phosphohydrolase [Desulforhopalus sp. 52FAK]